MTRRSCSCRRHAHVAQIKRLRRCGTLALQAFRIHAPCMQICFACAHSPSAKLRYTGGGGAHLLVRHPDNVRLQPGHHRREHKERCSEFEKELARYHEAGVAMEVDPCKQSPWVSCCVVYIRRDGHKQAADELVRVRANARSLIGCSTTKLPVPRDEAHDSRRRACHDRGAPHWRM